MKTNKPYSKATKEEIDRLVQLAEDIQKSQEERKDRQIRMFLLYIFGVILFSIVLALMPIWMERSGVSAGYLRYLQPPVLVIYLIIGSLTYYRKKSNIEKQQILDRAHLKQLKETIMLALDETDQLTTLGRTLIELRFMRLEG